MKQKPQITTYWLAQLPFLQNSVHMHKDSTAYSGLSPPTLITNQENSPHMPTDQSDGSGGDSSIEVPSSQVTLAGVKLTKTDQHV